MASSFEFPGRYYEIIRADIRDLAAETAFFASYLPTGGRVLDLGCGTGTVLRALAARGVTGVGVDQSRSFLEYARGAGEAGIEFIHTRLSDFDTGEQFDLIYSIFLTVNYLPHAELLPLFRKVRRWLRPGGRFVVDAGHLLTHVDSYQPYIIAHHERDEVLITRLIRHRLDAHAANWRQEETILVRDETGQVSMFKNFFDQSVLTGPELRHLLGDAGLSVVEEYGGYAKQPPAAAGRGPLVLVTAAATTP